MKKIILFVLCILSFAAINAQVSLKIGSGSYLVTKGTAQLVIDTGSIVNNGNYMDSTGTLVASGGIAVSGSGVTRLNNFTVSNTQHSVMNSTVSVYKTANLSSGFLDANNNLYVRSDASSAANMVVSGVLANNVKGIIAKATATSGACPSYTSNLSLNISGPVVNYQWQKSTDSASWTNVSGATLSAYTATVTATVFYRCSLTTSNSSFSEATPGVKLLYGPLPDAGSITGPSSVIVGSSISLTDPIIGGAWTASNGNATVTGGLVHGVSSGSVTISYAVTNSCGTTSATKVVSVGSGTTTVTVSAITGYFFYLCTGATAPFFDATTGGSWSINAADAGVASVSATGVVSGISAGTARLSYTVGASYASTVVTVYPTPTAIAGGSAVCAGSTIALTDATAGGTWSSSSTPTATVSSAGIVTGVLPGTTTIYYTIPASGCKASLVFTVTTAPSGIGGLSWVCVGTGISVSDFVAGGTWSSTSPASVAATGAATALVTGVSAGTATITYSLGASCYRTYNVTVKPQASPISGNLSVCGVGAVTFLSDVTAGTSWTISPVGTATISPSGRVYGVSPGTATVTYNTTTGCTAIAVATVNALVAIPPISGATSVGHGLSITLSDASAGGMWSSSNPVLGSVDAFGDVTGVGTSGTVTITYVLAYGSGCIATAAKLITVHTPAPPSHSETVGGTVTILTGTAVGLDDEGGGGIWSSSNTTVVTVDGGKITGVAAGAASITHSITSPDGEVSTSVTPVVVSSVPFDIRAVPNPSNGTFTLKGIIGTTQDVDVTLEVTDVIGQVIYNNKVTAYSGRISEVISLSNTLANGMYMMNICTATGQKVFHFVIEK